MGIIVEVLSLCQNLCVHWKGGFNVFHLMVVPDPDENIISVFMC